MMDTCLLSNGIVHYPIRAVGPGSLADSPRMLALLLLPLAPLVSGHGGVVWPPIWQEGRDIALEDRRDHYAFTDPVSRDPNTNRAYESVKTWLTDQAYTGGHGDQFKGIGPVTNINKKALAKFDRCNRACVRDRQPWAAPGQAPTLGGGCGVFGGNPFGCPAHQVWYGVV